MKSYALLASSCALAVTGCLPRGPAPEPPGKPSVQILEPRQGYTIPSSSVSVVVEVENGTVSREGLHLHVVVDGGAALELYAATPIRLADLPDGKHTVVVDLAGPDHRAVASATSAFVVDRRARPHPEPLRPPQPQPCPEPCPKPMPMDTGAGGRP